MQAPADRAGSYAGEAVDAAQSYAGLGSPRAWELAFEHAQTLTTWRLLKHSPEVAGRGLVLLSWGASIYRALAGARESLGLDRGD